MWIHSDFSLRAIVTPDQHQCVHSPMASVARVMLDGWGKNFLCCLAPFRTSTGTVRQAGICAIHPARRINLTALKAPLPFSNFGRYGQATSIPCALTAMIRLRGRPSTGAKYAVCFQTTLSRYVCSAELLLLDGSVVMADQTCERGSWLRLRCDECPDIAVIPQLANLYFKTWHLTPAALAAYNSTTVLPQNAAPGFIARVR